MKFPQFFVSTTLFLSIAFPRAIYAAEDFAPGQLIVQYRKLGAGDETRGSEVLGEHQIMMNHIESCGVRLGPEPFVPIYEDSIINAMVGQNKTESEVLADIFNRSMTLRQN